VLLHKKSDNSIKNQGKRGTYTPTDIFLFVPYVCQVEAQPQFLSIRLVHYAVRIRLDLRRVTETVCRARFRWFVDNAIVFDYTAFEER